MSTINIEKPVPFDGNCVPSPGSSVMLKSNWVAEKPTRDTITGRLFNDLNAVTIGA